MRSRSRATLTLLVLGAVMAGQPQTQAASAPAAKLTLRPSYGGAVLEGRVFVPRTDALIGVWSGAGFARLMKCAPRCTVVPSIPLSNTMVFGNASAYRVALGGDFRPGQKVNVTLRLRGQGVVITQAVVSPR